MCAIVAMRRRTPGFEAPRPASVSVFTPIAVTSSPLPVCDKRLTVVTTLS